MYQPINRLQIVLRIEHLSETICGHRWSRVTATLWSRAAAPIKPHIEERSLTGRWFDCAFISQFLVLSKQTGHNDIVHYTIKV